MSETDKLGELDSIRDPYGFAVVNLMRKISKMGYRAALEDELADCPYENANYYRMVTQLLADAPVIEKEKEDAVPPTSNADEPEKSEAVQPEPRRAVSVLGESPGVADRSDHRGDSDRPGTGRIADGRREDGRDLQRPETEGGPEEPDAEPGEVEGDDPFEIPF